MNRRLVVLCALAMLLVCAVAFARVGGGQSYSGGGSSSSGGSSGSSHSSGSSSYSSSGSSSTYSGGGGGGGQMPSGCAIAFFVVFVVLILAVQAISGPSSSSSVQSLNLSTAVPERKGPGIEELRRFDPNFSRIVFEDFCYSLYARVHHARGTGDLERYAPYLGDGARRALERQRVNEVQGIIVGSMEVSDVLGLDTPVVRVMVTFESNMTEVASAPATFYVRERWELERRRDILSPPPGKADAEHCPRCGAALKTRTDGSCEYCNVRITDGSFQWYVRSMLMLSKEPRGPQLTSNVPEQGTDLPTVMQPDLADRAKQLQAMDPGFTWESLAERVRQIAITLQDAWTARDWERVRPLETEPLFQMHRYWIDAYLRQKLRNVVDDYTLQRIDPVKIEVDPFYAAFTVRLWATGRDYTVNETGMAISGSKTAVRQWSEYWTVIRSRGEGAEAGKTMSCPNCGASVVVGSTGICTYCGGKLAGGEFGWILSRIEQDESYTG